MLCYTISSSHLWLGKGLRSGNSAGIVLSDDDLELDDVVGGDLSGDL